METESLPAVATPASALANLASRINAEHRAFREAAESAIEHARRVRG
jgi:hypothetical protein